MLNGLIIHAANYHDLWMNNLSAPRMLRTVSSKLGSVDEGDMVVQTASVHALNEKLAIGGLLLWRDKGNFLRLDRGAAGKQDINFMGCVDNKDIVFGRGILRDVNKDGQIYLRLECIGKEVCALCSADGERWWKVGKVAFSIVGPVRVGLYAIGNIERSIYHGAFPDGTAIRFTEFKMWQL
jgi:hypothetical protein